MNTKILTFYHTYANIDYMNSRRHEPLNSLTLFDEIVHDEDFEQHRQGYDPRTAFGITALTLAELGTSSSGERTRSSDQLHVAATICDYVRTIGELDESNTDISPVDRKKFVLDSVVFNHALESLIENDPETSYPELFKFTYRLYKQLFPRDTQERNEQVAKSLTSTLNGIRGEIIGEQLASYLGYPVEKATVEEDMCGIDRHLAFEAGWIGVDFKVDPDRAIKARMKRPQSLILTVPVERDVIGTSFYYSPHDVETYAAYLEKELTLEWQRYTQYHAQQRMYQNRVSKSSRQTQSRHSRGSKQRRR